MVNTPYVFTPKNKIHCCDYCRIRVWLSYVLCGNDVQIQFRICRETTIKTSDCESAIGYTSYNSASSPAGFTLIHGTHRRIPETDGNTHQDPDPDPDPNAHARANCHTNPHNESLRKFSN